MKAQTFLEAYEQAQEDKLTAVANRPKHNWGIMVDDDQWARLYQKRQRQGEKFLTRFCKKDAPPVERKQRDDLLAACKEALKHWYANDSYGQGTSEDGQIARMLREAIAQVEGPQVHRTRDRDDEAVDWSERPDCMP